MRKIICIGLIMLAVYVTGCINKEYSPEKEEVEPTFIVEDKPIIEDSLENEETIEQLQPLQVDGWVAYWQYKWGWQEIDEINYFFEKYNMTSDVVFKGIQLFAAEINEDTSLHVRSILNETELKLEDKETYITIVNDVKLTNGGYRLKDTQIISTICSSLENRQKHINEIVEMINSFEEQGINLDGVELDYEKIGKTDWENYIRLIDELGQVLNQKNKKLRVILEPQSPIEEYDFPQEYDYVLMVYNLYGAHSGPGPKADLEWINYQAKRMSDKFRSPVLAFSLGGFDWGNPEKVKPLTLYEAEQLLIESGSEKKRDKQSEAIWFEYTDDNGIKHTVWYANGETIQSWINVARDYGINKISLWRFGGNLEEVEES